MAFELREGEIAEITHDDKTTYSIHTEITIDAPPEKVWAVLTDFDKLSEWSDSPCRLEGDFRKDGMIEADFKLGIGNMTNTVKHQLIHFEEGRMFGWSDPLPMPGTRDNHKYIVEPREDGKTQFIQTDQVTGRGAHWVGGMMARQFNQMYVVFNRALKERVEGMA